MDTKDCILKTEERLRRLVDAVLRREYGPNWEDDSKIGWSKNKKTGLENTRKNTRRRFSHEEHSTRLIDYSYILDLKWLVSKNQSLFEPIFSPWDEKMMMFDILDKIRNKGCTLES